MLEEQSTPTPLIPNLSEKLTKMRNSCGRNAKDCADFLGISLKRYQNIEADKIMLSLPEMESLAYFFGVRPQDLLDDQPVMGRVIADGSQLRQLMQIRHRVISATLQLVRTQKNLSLKTVSEQTQIPASRIKRYENSGVPIPLDDLIQLAKSLDIDLDTLLDQGGFLSQWRGQEEKIRSFLQLPQELQVFFTTPENQEYMRLAIRMKDTGIDHLEELANGLRQLANKARE